MIFSYNLRFGLALVVGPFSCYNVTMEKIEDEQIREELEQALETWFEFVKEYKSQTTVPLSFVLCSDPYDIHPGSTLWIKDRKLGAQIKSM